MYNADLAYVHDAGFGNHARRIAPGLLALLAEASGRCGIRPTVTRGTRAPRPHVVDVGCGSGILSRALVDAGYQVLGIDQSASMIRLARRAVPEATFRVQGLERARLPRCVAVVAIGEIVTYVPSAPAVRRFFEHARRALPDGGLLVFDFLSSARGRTYRRRERAGAGWRIELSATASPSQRVVIRRMCITRRIGRSVRRSRESHRIRIYSRGEMQALLRASGFRAIFRRTLGGYRLPASDLVAIASPE